ncbi:hypothetical protein CNR33_00088 [Pseudomonas phage tabernarius]|uniref:Uncharacterized protein n=1 Tax=Pseudomonas phage tabernarius TaxID=2048978 RepID=A0A2H4P6X3_9CAUD|nr:hypothetical protein FDJ17_gp88 [Pseudomonas phage tabernarius]ATW57934.1 hypothetical protein CNR33_00088 [Pseudomonas phage tabernarius]
MTTIFNCRFCHETSSYSGEQELFCSVGCQHDFAVVALYIGTQSKRGNVPYSEVRTFLEDPSNEDTLERLFDAAKPR